MQWTLHRRSWKAFFKKSSEKKHEIPEVSPPFTEKELPHASTRLTPSDYKGDLSCFLFKQNKVSRPKSKERGRENQGKT